MMVGQDPWQVWGAGSGGPHPADELIADALTDLAIKARGATTGTREVVV